MRTVVAVLAIFAIGKIYVQQNFYRSAMDDAVVAAYRDAAIVACQKTQKNMPRSTASYLWQRPSKIIVRVGQPELGIMLWDYEHPKWNDRFRVANLILRPSDTRTPLMCRFEIKTGKAAILSA